MFHIQIPGALFFKSLLLRYFLNFIVLLLVVSCSKSTDTAGTDGSTETTNGITVTVRDESGRHLAGAKVVLVSQTSWLENVISGQSPVIDSGFTDKNGVYYSSYDRKENLWVLSQNQSLGKRTLVSSQENNIVEALTPLVKVIGRVSDFSKGKLFLQGLPQSFQIDSTGRFTCENLPSGNYESIMEESSLDLFLPGDAIDVNSLNMPTDTLRLNSSTNEILLENFEDGNLLPLIATHVDYGFWWMDIEKSTESKIVQVYPSTPFEGLQSENGNKFLGFEFSIFPEGERSWMNFGFDLGVSGLRRNVDFRTIRGVKFLARGEGSWNMALVSGDGQEIIFVEPIELSPDWTEIEIAFTPNTDQIQALSKTSALFFQTEVAGKLDIDDIRVIGVDMRAWTLSGYN